jgi:hypothetical protein
MKDMNELLPELKKRKAAGVILQPFENHATGSFEFSLRLS